MFNEPDSLICWHKITLDDFAVILSSKTVDITNFHLFPFFEILL